MRVTSQRAAQNAIKLEHRPLIEHHGVEIGGEVERIVLRDDDVGVLRQHRQQAVEVRHLPELRGVGDRALRIDVSALIGREVDRAAISDVVRAGTQDLEASSDLHATAAYRQRVAAVFGTRALEDAFAEARSHGGTVQ